MVNNKSKYLRKQVVFNRDSAWHMEILRRINEESDNFSGYVMSILKSHFDIKPDLSKKKEQPNETEETTADHSENIKIEVGTKQTIYKGGQGKPKLF